MSQPISVQDIYQDKELNEEATRKKFFLVRQEGERQLKREIDHYNLDMIYQWLQEAFC